MSEIYFPCKKCGHYFHFYNYIPEKVICIDCRTEYSMTEILKGIKKIGDVEKNNDR